MFLMRLFSFPVKQRCSALTFPLAHVSSRQEFQCQAPPDCSVLNSSETVEKGRREGEMGREVNQDISERE